MLALHKNTCKACLLEAAETEGRVGERREGAGLAFLLPSVLRALPGSFLYNHHHRDVIDIHKHVTNP